MSRWCDRHTWPGCVGRLGAATSPPGWRGCSSLWITVPVSGKTSTTPTQALTQSPGSYWRRWCRVREGGGGGGWKMFSCVEGKYSVSCSWLCTALGSPLPSSCVLSLCLSLVHAHTFSCSFSLSISPSLPPSLSLTLSLSLSHSLSLRLSSSPCLPLASTPFTYLVSLSTHLPPPPPLPSPCRCWVIPRIAVLQASS